MNRMEGVNSAWFAGPKGENADWFADLLDRVVWDYYFWRRNYFPEDGAVITSRDRRTQEQFRDQFDDLLNELLGRLKGDCPFHSPRYAGHMVAEQTLPSIAGYFAAMLYNPNNVTSESAPVTVQLELEAASLISRMLGHGDTAWAHLCSGGTLANFESLWVARTLLYLPDLVHDARKTLGRQAAAIGTTPQQYLDAFARLFEEGPDCHADVMAVLRESPYNIAEQGFAAVEARCGYRPVLVVPETHHYCFDKGLDLLGFGRQSIVRVKVTSEFRMDAKELEKTLDRLDVEGRRVAAVVAVMGTTEEGAIDPLNEIVALRERRETEGKPSFWLHADAAYGGYLRSIILPDRLGLGEPRTEVHIRGVRQSLALQLPENHACDALSVLGECDSITVDPHKLGYIPYPAGAVSFRDERVKPLVRQIAPYLEEGSQSFGDDVASTQVGVYSLEGSKPGAVAAAVWLSHRSIPLDLTGHGALMRETIRQACTFHALLGHAWSDSIVAVPLCPPGSNIVCYAFRHRAMDRLVDINSLNRRLYDRLSIGREERPHVYSQKFFVSRTTLAARQYRVETVRPFLDSLGVTPEEYEEHGVFLLRSVLMNPWYQLAKEHGDDVLSRLVEHMFQEAEALAG